MKNWDKKKEAIFVTSHGNVSWDEFLMVYAFAPESNELRKELVEAIELTKKYEKKYDIYKKRTPNQTM